MPKCLECGSAELSYRSQPAFEFSQNILKTGKIAKLTKKDRLNSTLRPIPDSSPEWIECNSCGKEYNFEFDDMDRVVNLSKRN